jgi:hypothetical protein
MSVIAVMIKRRWGILAMLDQIVTTTSSEAEIFGFGTPLTGESTSCFGKIEDFAPSFSY